MVALHSRSVFQLSSAVAVFGAIAACSSGGPTVEIVRHPGSIGTGASALTIPFAGAGNAGQSQLLSAGFTPNACAVAGPAANFDGGTMQVAGPDRVTCYFSSVSPGTPMAFLEQVVETAEGQGLVHVRLTMNPAFVDNTYGTTAIGWGATDAGAAAMPAPGGPAGKGGAGAPMGGPGAPMAGKGPGHGGHTFNDLVGSDHAEFDLSDASGATVLSFNLDYITAVTGAPSGYATLAVSGGDGKMLTGDPGAIVYASTSLDRDLNACGYASYTTDSPATDALYTPNASTPDWDYRVVYDVWVKASAFAGGFGAATIPYVHASPSKLAATVPVAPGPCPPPFGGCDGGPCDVPACEGEGCSDGPFDDDASTPVVTR